MTPDDVHPAHTQASYPIRMEWGATGAAATVSEGRAAYAVVVDVLSFTTSTTIAVERGIEVFPFGWRDSRAAAHALRLGATLALGRFEARGRGEGQVSLSPGSIAAVEGVRRLVLPSPNGSAISATLVDSGSVVLAASLRNRSAVAAWLAPRLEAGASLTVIAAGARWPDGTLRPAAEDLWGAGAVLAALTDLGAERLSPEAMVAEAAFRSVAASLPDSLLACAGGRELVEGGFAGDVELAAELDVSATVPVLEGERFVDA